jgi:hypothetical protein
MPPIHKTSTDDVTVAHIAVLIALSAFKPHIIFSINGGLTEEGIFRISGIPFDILQIWYSLQGGNIAIWLLFSATVRFPNVLFTLKYLHIRSLCYHASCQCILWPLGFCLAQPPSQQSKLKVAQYVRQIGKQRRTKSREVGIA